MTCILFCTQGQIMYEFEGDGVALALFGVSYNDIDETLPVFVKNAAELMADSRDVYTVSRSFIHTYSNTSLPNVTPFL